MLRAVGWRLYQDYLMRSRIGQLRELISTAQQGGYRCVSIEEWSRIVTAARSGARSGALTGEGRRYLILRNDVDTDPATALAMCDVQEELGVKGSFYFRLKTFDSRIVEESVRRGFDVSYHFEEIADFAKEHGLKSRAEVDAHMTEIQDRFARNITRLRRRYGVDMRIVCSHGDWVNRRLGILNHALLKDRSFRQSVGVEYETYDEVLTGGIAARFSDSAPPRFWTPDRATTQATGQADPLSAVKAGLSPVYVLTHPRHWRASWRWDTAESSVRLIEDLRFRLGLYTRSARFGQGAAGGRA